MNAGGSLDKLLALLATLAVALVAIWVVTRHERRKPPGALVAGYPPAEFPLAVIEGPLGSLCRTQAALLALYRQLPAKSPARPRLLAFLEELRGLMDAAYELARHPDASGTEARLARLSQEAQSAADEMTKSTLRLAESEGSGDSELDLRLEVMRTLARDVDDL